MCVCAGCSQNFYLHPRRPAHRTSIYMRPSHARIRRVGCCPSPRPSFARAPRLLVFRWLRLGNKRSPPKRDARNRGTQSGDGRTSTACAQPAASMRRSCRAPCAPTPCAPSTTLLRIRPTTRLLADSRSAHELHHQHDTINRQHACTIRAPRACKRPRDAVFRCAGEPKARETRNCIPTVAGCGEAEVRRSGRRRQSFGRLRVGGVGGLLPFPPSRSPEATLHAKEAKHNQRKRLLRQVRPDLNPSSTPAKPPSPRIAYKASEGTTKASHKPSDTARSHRSPRRSPTVASNEPSEEDHRHLAARIPTSAPTDVSFHCEGL